MADSGDVRLLISGVRIASEMSCPLMETSVPSAVVYSFTSKLWASRVTASASSGLTSCCRTAHASARYMAPVST